MSSSLNSFNPKSIFDSKQYPIQFNGDFRIYSSPLCAKKGFILILCFEKVISTDCYNVKGKLNKDFLKWIRIIEDRNRVSQPEAILLLIPLIYTHSEYIINSWGNTLVEATPLLLMLGCCCRLWSTENRFWEGADQVVQHGAHRREGPAQEDLKGLRTLPLLPVQTLPRERLPGIHRWIQVLRSRGTRTGWGLRLLVRSLSRPSLD